jgi:ABC-type nitrate/sulfonate/bicarbonate transport system ATPase subunit
LPIRQSPVIETKWDSAQPWSSALSAGRSLVQISVKNLSFSYENAKPILRDIDFHVDSGGNLAILGASGCGKSTILKLISGIIKNSGPRKLSGEITVGDCDVVNNINSYKNLRSQGKIGYFPQSPIIFDHLTVIENIKLPLTLINSKNDSGIQNLIDLVGLRDHLQKLPYELSGGMRTRTALARLFSTMPELLILDEPFSSLDITRKSKIFAQFDALRGVNRATTVLVTHDIFEAILFSKHIFVMNSNGISEIYEVDDWFPNQSYESIVTNYYHCFAKIREMID